MGCEIRVIRYKYDGPGLIFCTNSLQNLIPHIRLHVVDHSVEHKELRSSQNGAREENPEDVARGRNLPEYPDVGVDSKGERRNLALELSQLECPSDIFVRDVGTAPDDVVRDRSVEQGQV